MGNHEDRCSPLLDLLHLPVTFCLEEYVSDGQGLVDDQDLRLHINVERKRQTDEHTAGVCLHRLIDKIADIRKIQDILQLLIHLLPGIAHHRAVHIDIFDSGVVHVEAGTKLQKCGDLSLHVHLACGRCEDTGDDL